jgi:hypothetical protein
VEVSSQKQEALRRAASALDRLKRLPVAPVAAERGLKGDRKATSETKHARRAGLEVDRAMRRVRRAESFKRPERATETLDALAARFDALDRVLVRQFDALAQEILRKGESLDDNELESYVDPSHLGDLFHRIVQARDSVADAFHQDREAGTPNGVRSIRFRLQGMHRPRLLSFRDVERAHYAELFKNPSGTARELDNQELAQRAIIAEEYELGQKIASSLEALELQLDEYLDAGRHVKEGKGALDAMRHELQSLLLIEEAVGLLAKHATELSTVDEFHQMADGLPRVAEKQLHRAFSVLHFGKTAYHWDDKTGTVHPELGYKLSDKERARLAETARRMQGRLAAVVGAYRRAIASCEAAGI